MKTIPLALLTLLLLNNSALTQDRLSVIGLGGRDSDSVELGEFVFKLKRYMQAEARMNSADVISIRSKSGALDLPWASAPASLQRAMAEKRKALLAESELKAAGVEWVGGVILNRTGNGFLVNDARQKLIIHVVGKTDMADGERWAAQCRREGLYEYLAVSGAKSTVKNYVAP